LAPEVYLKRYLPFVNRKGPYNWQVYNELFGIKTSIKYFVIEAGYESFHDIPGGSSYYTDGFWGKVSWRISLYDVIFFNLYSNLSGTFSPMPKLGLTVELLPQMFVLAVDLGGNEKGFQASLSMRLGFWMGE